MIKLNNKFKKVVVLDTIIFYPEHRALLNSIAEEIVEYPSSLPDGLEKQYEESPHLFVNKKCYTQIATDNIPLQLLMDRVAGADVIISCWTNIPNEILRLNPQLKLVIFWTHEKEHRIDVKLAHELGITVTNVPDYGTDAVAEVVFAGLELLLQRNFSVTNNKKDSGHLAHAIINHTFNHFRQLLNNEKNTRSGKFTHHFHKIGQAKFDFSQKNLTELIPEKLIEHKRVGLLNTNNGAETIKTLSAFGVVCENHKTNDTTLASYYKFLAENDLIFYDKMLIEPIEIKKISLMFNDKLVDINTLPAVEYNYTNKIFGIVGMGRIGVKVATIAKKLGFDVIYYSRKRNLAIESKIGARFTELNTLAETSDVVSIHLPAHKADRLFDSKLIAKLKNRAIFINTADGNVIDQLALTQRMLDNEIFAYLDVYPGLPRKDILGLPMKDKADWKIHKELENSVIAYRAGWKTQESINVKTYKLLGTMLDFLVK